ncbi:MAG: DUF493 domain-containing protein [Isosphaeraceae bacterium]|jgi:putative lipoic acid-binding regulatory protein|nr:DUF493 domain-containing protein [Isosphaeraceae bacterium]
MDHAPSLDLLESTHVFPGVYQIKAIGKTDDDFERRVIEAVLGELAAASDLDHNCRSTPGGRHVSVTLDITVQSADQVRQIYARIRECAGLSYLF